MESMAILGGNRRPHRRVWYAGVILSLAAVVSVGESASPAVQNPRDLARPHLPKATLSATGGVREKGDKARVAGMVKSEAAGSKAAEKGRWRRRACNVCKTGNGCSESRRRPFCSSASLGLTGDCHVDILSLQYKSDNWAEKSPGAPSW